MDEELAQKWLAIVKKLAANETARLVCPSCDHYILDVRDEDIDEAHFERFVECPECNFSESIFINREEDDKRKRSRE